MGCELDLMGWLDKLDKLDKLDTLDKLDSCINSIKTKTSFN